SELCIKICSEIHKKVELKNAGGMRTPTFTPVLAAGGMPVYKELNQAQYDKAITDKHIQNLEQDTDLIRVEALTETQMCPRASKTANVVLNSPIKNKDLGKLRRIMIVDDERDVTFLFKIILESMYHDATFSCKVDSFNDSLTALENYQEGLYDLVIIDIVMPKMDGFKLYKELRKKDKNVKICFLTAGEMYYEEYRKHVIPEVSPDKIIRKPISNADLVRIINKYFVP
ncbi:MAG: response regulator, partial [Ignavibacteriales bacterium]